MSCPTYKLPTAKVTNIFDARAHAEQIGLPFTEAITVRWEMVADGMTHHEALRRLVKLQRCWRQWLKYRGVGYASAWTWESDNRQGVGVHTHIALHLPARLRNDFEQYLRVHLAPKDKNALDCKQNTPFRGPGRQSGSLGWCRYMCKDSTEAARRKYKIPDDIPAFAPTASLVEVKRHGVSHNLSPAAIARHATQDKTKRAA